MYSALRPLFCLAITVSALALPSSLRADDEEQALLNPTTAPYVYEAVAAKPKGVAFVASMISADFKNAPDEFAQWDFLQKLLPVIQRKIKQVKDTPVFVIKIGHSLDRYDFDAMAFPTGFSSATFIPMRGTTNAVRFANVEKFSQIPVPIEAARKFQIALRQSRNVTLEVTVKPVSGAPDSLNGTDYDVISAEIKSFRILMPDGQVLAEKAL